MHTLFLYVCTPYINTTQYTSLSPDLFGLESKYAWTPVQPRLD